MPDWLFVEMLSFKWPLALWGLLILPFLIVLHLLAQKKRWEASLQVASLSSLKAAKQVQNQKFRLLPLLLQWLVLLCLIVALARPQILVNVPEHRVDNSSLAALEPAVAEEVACP